MTNQISARGQAIRYGRREGFKRAAEVIREADADGATTPDMDMTDWRDWSAFAETSAKFAACPSGARAAPIAPRWRSLWERAFQQGAQHAVRVWVRRVEREDMSSFTNDPE